MRTQFAQGDYFRIANLQEHIYVLRQGSQSITDYFTRIKTLWDEFINMRPTPLCSCDPACSSGADQKAHHYQYTDQVICFLKDLNDNFGTIRSQIVLMSPLPDIDKSF